MSDTVNQNRDEAHEQSRGCMYCSGQGLATVYHPRYDGFASIEANVMDHRGEIVQRPIPARVSAHCICPMGRWMRSRTERELVSRIPDLMDILAGRSRWLAYDPTGEAPAVPGLTVERMKRTIGINVGAKR